VGFWRVSDHLATFEPVQVSGLLQVQIRPADPGATGNPPNGYFIEATAIGRVYLEPVDVKQYVGIKVVARGRLSRATCGNDGQSCYPVIAATSILEAK